MKTDLYTKAVLTVIAIALVTIVLRDVNIVTPAQAQVPLQTQEPKVTKSVRTSTMKPNDKLEPKAEEPVIYNVNIVQINGKSIGHEDNKEQMPVYVKNSNIPVYFKGIPYVKVSNYYDFGETKSVPN